MGTSSKSKVRPEVAVDVPDVDTEGRFPKGIYSPKGEYRVVQDEDELAVWADKGWKDEPIVPPSAHGKVFGRVRPEN